MHVGGLLPWHSHVVASSRGVAGAVFGLAPRIGRLGRTALFPFVASFVGGIGAAVLPILSALAFDLLPAVRVLNAQLLCPTRSGGADNTEYHQGHHAANDAHEQAHAHEREVEHDLGESCHRSVALIDPVVVLEVEIYPAISCACARHSISIFTQ